MDGFCKLSNQVPRLLGFGEIRALHIYVQVFLKHRIIQLNIGFKMIDTEKEQVFDCSRAYLLPKGFTLKKFLELNPPPPQSPLDNYLKYTGN